MQQLLDILRDMPEFLKGFIQDHGAWVYALLFAIIFAETGLVIMPFLPGDSLLFTVGVLSASGAMNVWLVSALLIVAAVLGDAVNYHIGKWIGPRVFKYDPASCPPGSARWLIRLLNRKHLDRAHQFYEKYGGKAVVLGRFVPIVRTFVPFVAGAGAMTYRTFVLYNVIGAMLWIGLCVAAGYIFGGYAWVQEHFEAVIVGIIVISLIPVGVEALLAWRRGRTNPAPAPPGSPDR
ncbi:MAG: VTT domain-containing protein, partial [Phycisphaerales bacterium]